MMCPDYGTQYILKYEHKEQEIEQTFVLHLTQTNVWIMIIVVREIMEIKNSPNDVAATTYVTQTVTQPTKIKSLHILA